MECADTIRLVVYAQNVGHGEQRARSPPPRAAARERSERQLREWREREAAARREYEENQRQNNVPKQTEMNKKIINILLTLLIIAAIGLFVYVVYDILRDEERYGASLQLMFDKRKVESSKAIGDKIVLALQDYYSRNNRYPQNLEELVKNNHLQKIDPPLAGDPRWDYWISDNHQEFSLCFGAGEACYPSCCKSSKDLSKWNFDS